MHSIDSKSVPGMLEQCPQWGANVLFQGCQTQPSMLVFLHVRLQCIQSKTLTELRLQATVVLFDKIILIWSLYIFILLKTNLYRYSSASLHLNFIFWIHSRTMSMKGGLLMFSWRHVNLVCSSCYLHFRDLRFSSWHEKIMLEEFMFEKSFQLKANNFYCLGSFT